MKKLLGITLLVLGTPFALAQYTGGTAPSNPGGYSGPSAANTVMTVKAAKEMRDDSYVTLRGRITQHLHKDKYLFADSTGEITIEIDHDKWHGVTAGPEDLLEIYGEVEKDWNKVEIDVDRVRKVN